MISQVHIVRVLEWYDPFTALDLEQGQLQDVFTVPVIREPHLLVWGQEWSAAEHLGRIRFFVEDPDQIDPIEIDNMWDGDRPSGLLVVDGHHRLLAAHRLGWGKISCTYGGWVDVLEYLTGERETCPFA